MSEFKDYIAEDGTMSLVSRYNGGMREGYDGELETAFNDNGIMGRTLLMFLNPMFKVGYLTTIRLLESVIPGLFHRNAGRDDYINSDDNLLLMACGCAKVGDKSIFKRILKHFWPLPIWNDEKGRAGKLQLKTKLRPSGFFQPHVWAMFQLAAGFLWEPLSAAWLGINLLVHAWFPKPWNPDRRLIAWARCLTIEERQDRILFLYRPFLNYAVRQFKADVIKVGGIQREFARYYGKDKNHPLYLKSRGVMWRK